MRITPLDVRKQESVQHLWMSAELRASKDDKLVKVWSRSGNVVELSNQAFTAGILPPNLSRDITNFFRSLRADFVDARRQFGT